MKRHLSLVFLWAFALAAGLAPGGCQTDSGSDTGADSDMGGADRRETRPAAPVDGGTPAAPRE